MEVLVFDRFTKFVAVSTVITGTFGLCYQKGLIVGMGLGNLSGSYEIKEIFNSAVLGYLHIFSILEASLNPLEVFKEFLWVMSCVGIAAGIGIWIARKITSDIKARVLERLGGIFKSFLGVGFVGVCLAVAASGVIALLPYVLISALVVFLMPLLVGYQVGMNKVEDMISQPPCAEYLEDGKKTKILRQCTQLVLGGKRIMGEVVLENSGGYFIHANKSFVYLAKDGKSCVYSKFSAPPPDKKEGRESEFEPSQVDKICKDKEHAKTV